MRYGIRKRLKCGESLLLFLTFRCTLKCDYCALKYIDGKYPESKEIELSEWKRIVKSFPRKIREIKITGGEPMLMPWFPEFVNWLAKEGYSVFIISNLTLQKKFKKSDKVMINCTYHKSANKTKWLRNLAYYKDFQIKIDEIETGEIVGSDVKELCHREYGDTCEGFIYSPEGKLFTNVNEMYVEYV